MCIDRITAQKECEFFVTKKIANQQTDRQITATTPRTCEALPVDTGMFIAMEREKTECPAKQILMGKLQYEQDAVSRFFTSNLYLSVLATEIVDKKKAKKNIEKI